MISEGDLLKHKGSGDIVEARESAPPWPVKTKGVWATTEEIDSDRYEDSWENLTKQKREGRGVQDLAMDQFGVLCPKCGERLDVTGAYKQAMKEVGKESAKDGVTEAILTASGVPPGTATMYTVVKALGTYSRYSDQREVAVRWFESIEYISNVDIPKSDYPIGAGSEAEGRRTQSGIDLDNLDVVVHDDDDCMRWLDIENA